jgi:tetratricopeptide (TPR) repeat protein
MAQYQKAIDSYQIAASLDQKNPITYEALGFSYYDLKQYKKALSAFQKVLKIKPKDYMTYQTIAHIYNIRPIPK